MKCQITDSKNFIENNIRQFWKILDMLDTISVV